MKLRHGIATLVAGMLALVVGCAVAPALAAGSQSAATYVRVTGDSAVLVQWTDVGGKLSGTVDSATLSSDESKISVAACTLDGSESGAALVVDITCPGSGSLRLSGSVTASGIVLDVPQTSGTVQPAAFSEGSVGEYDAAVRHLYDKTEAPSLRAYVTAHDVAPDAALFGQPITVETPPFTARGQTLALVGYNTSPRVAPVLAVLSWSGRSWSQVWLAAVFGGWTGLPYRLTPLALGKGVVTYGLNGVQTAGDDSPGAVVSDAGGRWHLVAFVLPLHSLAFGKPGSETTTLTTPGFGPGGTVTLAQVWDAGECQELLKFRYDAGRGVFVPNGPLQDRFKSSSCKAF